MMNWEGLERGRGKIKVLLRHFSGGIGETYEKPQSG
jgi:hypothetical protein